MTNGTRTIGEIAIHIGSGVTPRGGETTYVAAGIPLIRSQNVLHGWLDLSEVAYVSTDVHAQMGRSAVRPGDVLLNITGASIGRSCVVPGDLAEANVNQHVCIIRPSADVLPGFVQAALELPGTQRRIRILAAGGRGLNYEQVSSLAVPWIEPPQQQKLQKARALFDKAKCEIDRLLRAKRYFKRGLMEQLLTGARRFKEFGGEPWHELPLADCFESVERRVEWDDSATYNLLSIRRRSGGVFLRSRAKGSAIKTKQMFEVRAGDFLISKMQVVHGALGIVKPEFDGMHVSGSYIVLRNKRPGELRTEFFDYLTHLGTMYRQALLSSYGVHVEKMTFNLPWYLKTRIRLPVSLQEQDMLVEALTMLNREIGLVERLRTAFDRQRRGVAELLLTGKGRVPT